MARNESRPIGKPEIRAGRRFETPHGSIGVPSRVRLAAAAMPDIAGFRRKAPDTETLSR